MGALWTFLRNSGIFVLGTVLSKLIAFIMLPLYTAVVPPEDFGYYDLSVTYLTVVCESLFLNIWVVILRRMYKSQDEQVRALQAGALVFLGSTLAYILLMVAAALLLDIRHLGLIACLGIVQNIEYVYKHACRGLRRNWDYAFSGVLASVVMMGMNVLLLVGLDWDFRALYVSTIVAYLCEIIYVEARVGVGRRMLSSSWRWGVRPAARTMLVLAIPVGLNALVYWTINSLNRAVVGAVLDLAHNGLFAIAMRFGAVMMLVITAMTYAWQDLAFERSREHSRFFSRAAGAYATALLLGLALLIPVLKVIFPWVIDPQYGAALTVIPLALAVSTLSGYSNFLVNIFYAIDRNADTLWAIGIAGAVNTACVLPMVHLWGLFGACISTLLGYSAGIAYMLYRLRGEIGMRVSPREPLAGLAVVGLAMLVFYLAGTAVNMATAAVILLAGVLGARRLMPRR
ncbi:lipopolysaccharide biosynthesis protein [Actinomyces bowdenii]|uniref:Lipopolysaccharide biosynthesis protein n=1 Tax=Actinomyces bowdenii TaxID=131109 RepID=A0A3P1V7I4_9ACTO|nr:polysaccharide biosynthesis C-terminal domain-containing protein [Actinomyces bowdenii]RRD29758.1 lipopolysaccharide biosynthesis protein [Actinomyces bowdenii]